MDKSKLIKFILFGLFFLVIALSIGLSFYFYNQYRTLKSNPDLVSQQETTSIVAKVSKYMELPSDETPSLATVTEVEKLKDQAFFANAADGDKILIYSKARKAILYRPKTDKVIEFAPLITQEEQQESSQQNPTTQKVSVTIYNASDQEELADEIEQDLADLDLEVVAKEDLENTDYDQTLVIDISGRNTALVNQIAEAIAGEVGDLPAGESEPDSEILIIASQ